MNAASASGVTKLDLTLANADMLPANIGNLKSLRELRIREPQFRIFYRDIVKLTNLEYVKVEYELRDDGGQSMHYWEEVEATLPPQCRIEVEY